MQKSELNYALYRCARPLLLATAFVATTAGYLPALPVVSEIGFIGGNRGVAISLSADAPFSATFSGKEKTATIVLNGCVYGLSEFSYGSFAAASPLRNITAKENKNSTVELTVSLKTNIKLPIRAVRKNAQWIALLSDEPVQPFTWSSAQGASLVSSVKHAGAQTPITSSQPSLLENIRFIQRGLVSELALEFDRDVSCSLQRKGATVTVTVENARNNIGNRLFPLPGAATFKQISIHEYKQETVAMLDISIRIDTITTESNFNIAFTKGSTISLFAMEHDNRKATLWTSGHGLSWDYRFYDVPSYNVDLQSMGNRARRDAKQKFSPGKTFSIKEPPVIQPQATASAPAQSIELASSAADTFSERKDNAPESIRMIVTANNLNLRSSPSLDGKVKGKLTRGDMVTVLEKRGDWHKIEAGGLTGYVAAVHLREQPSIDKIANRDTAQDGMQRKEELSPQIIGPSSSMTMVSTIKSTEPAPPLLQTVTAQEIIGSDNKQSAVSAPPGKRIIRYNGGGRDPFLPIVPSSVSLSGLPFVENLTLVGILYDDADRIALCEDIKNGNRPFSFREHDPVEKGKVLKIYRDKVVFLITEFGISRSFTLEFSRESPEKEVSKK